MNLEIAKTNIGWSCPICVSTQNGASVGHLILHVPIFSVAGMSIDMLQLLPNINLTLTIIMARATVYYGDNLAPSGTKTESGVLTIS